MILPIRIDRCEGAGLSDQITAQISRLIFKGVLPPGRKLWSCRGLARDLGVAVNTVTSAYSRLETEELIEARPRSGFFVSAKSGVHTDMPVRAHPPRPGGAPITAKLNRCAQTEKINTIQRPKDWRRYPYPFVCNQIDEADFPVAEWRECSRIAMARKSVNLWSADGENDDSPELIEQVNQRVLPRRGIFAETDSTLITLGSQNGIFLTSYLFGASNSVAAMEDPGYPDARRILSANFGKVVAQPVDEEGLIVDERLRGVDLVYTTPNRQFPTGVTLSDRRRRELLEAAEAYDFYIIEDDYACDVDFRPSPPMSLRASDAADRIIYLGSLSKSLAPGLRLGYLNASPKFIAAARDCRSMVMRHPPFLLQHTAAVFLEQAFYDGLLLRKKRDHKERWNIASSALESQVSTLEFTGAFGSTSFVAFDPEAQLDAQTIAAEAARHGILVEPIWPCYQQEGAGRSRFRIGVSSIPRDRIVPGLDLLNSTIDALRSSL